MKRRLAMGVTAVAAATALAFTFLSTPIAEGAYPPATTSGGSSTTSGGGVTSTTAGGGVTSTTAGGGVTTTLFPEGGSTTVPAGGSTTIEPTLPPTTVGGLPPDVEIELPTNDDGDAFIEPGQSFPVTFCCFEPGDVIEMFIEVPDDVAAQYSAQAVISSGPLTVAADGSVAWDVPGLPAGNYDLVLSVNGVAYRIELKVGTPMPIPAAGGGGVSLLRPALVLLVAGVALTMVATRRRRAVAPVRAD